MTEDSWQAETLAIAQRYPYMVIMSYNDQPYDNFIQHCAWLRARIGDSYWLHKDITCRWLYDYFNHRYQFCSQSDRVQFQLTWGA